MRSSYISVVKDASLTIRLPSATRARIEALAEAEGRSLSAQVERLLELAFATLEGRVAEDGTPAWGPRPLGGVLAGGRVPTLAEMREVREELSSSLKGPGAGDEDVRR